MDEKSIIKRLVQDYNKYSEMSVLLFEGSKLDMRDDPIIPKTIPVCSSLSITAL